MFKEGYDLIEEFELSEEDQAECRAWAIFDSILLLGMKEEDVYQMTGTTLESIEKYKAQWEKMREKELK